MNQEGMFRNVWTRWHDIVTSR